MSDQVGDQRNCHARTIVEFEHISQSTVCTFTVTQPPIAGISDFDSGGIERRTQSRASACALGASRRSSRPTEVTNSPRFTSAYNPVTVILNLTPVVFFPENALSRFCNRRNPRDRLAKCVTCCRAMFFSRAGSASCVMGQWYYKCCVHYVQLGTLPEINDAYRLLPTLLTMCRTEAEMPSSNLLKPQRWECFLSAPNYLGQA